jgi:CubicO group peptidase (beta-lactamase class C family)
VVDERAVDITLRDLVLHQSGWTRRTCTDLTIGNHLVAVAHGFGIPSPPPAWRLAQYFVGYPLDFAPGADPNILAPAIEEHDTYCNMGYVLLGLVAEARTGATLGALYDAYLFRPLEVAGHIEPGHTLPERRNPREPGYACDGGLVPSVFDPTQRVCFADGGFDLDGILAAGGLVGTAAAVGAVYEVFWNDGRLRDPGLVTYQDHSGSLPGTGTTAARYSLPGIGDVQFVVLFNKDTGHEDLPSLAWRQDDYQVLHGALLAAYAAAEASLP